jgi:CoB--CoM heterodisulfide reductase subunit A
MRIGVYVCHCGLNIARTIDVEEVREFANKEEDVVVSRDIDYLCSDANQETIKRYR